MHKPQSELAYLRAPEGDLPGLAVAALFAAVLGAVAVPILTHPLPPLSDYIDHMAGGEVIDVVGERRQRSRSATLLPHRVGGDPQSDDGPGGAGAAPLPRHLRGGRDFHAVDLRGHLVRSARAVARPQRALVGGAAAGEPVPLLRRAARRRDELPVRDRPRAVGIRGLGRAAGKAVALALCDLDPVRAGALLLPPVRARPLWPRAPGLRGASAMGATDPHPNPPLARFRGHRG